MFTLNPWLKLILITIFQPSRRRLIHFEPVQFLFQNHLDAQIMNHSLLWFSNFLKKRLFIWGHISHLNLIVGVWSNANNKVLRLVNFGKYLWFHWIFNFVVEFVHFDSYSISETRDLDFSKLFSSSPMLVSLRDTALIN